MQKHNKTIAIVLMTLIAALMIVSCDLTLGKPSAGLYTINYAELTAGTYEGKDNEYSYKLIISEPKEGKKNMDVELNIYVLASTEKEKPARTLTGTYSNEGYFTKTFTDDKTGIRWTENFLEEKMEFTKSSDSIDPSEYNSWFSFELINPKNASGDEYSPMYKTDLGTKVEFKEWENSFSSTSKKLASWMKGLTLTKTY